MRSSAPPFWYVSTSNMPSQSAGERTSYSTERVLASESVSKADACARGRTSSSGASRGGYASQAAISMNVANASLSQMPFHQRIVTRSPNHMWASSWATTSATTSRSLWVLVAGIDEQQVLAERDAAEVLHRAGGEVGQREQVDLVARVRDAVVVLEPAQAERADVERRTPVRWPLPGTCTTRSGMPSTSTGSVASSGPTTNATRYELIVIVSAKRIDDLAVGVGRAVDLGAVGDREEAGVDDERDAEHRLEVGLVPARERPPAVGGLHLGRGDHLLGAVVVGVRAAVEAAQLVVEDAGELDRRA